MHFAKLSVCCTIAIFLSTVADKPMNKIRVCGGTLNQSYEVYDTSCHRGLWMPEPVPAACICVTGTWLLMEDYCDSSFYILSGPSPKESSGAGTQYSCFEFSKQFRRFISLTSETKMYYQYIMQNNGRFIESVDRHDLSYTPSGETPVVVVRLNANSEMYMTHKAGVHSDIWQKCLGLRNPRTFNHIIKSEESVSSLKSTTEEETCEDLKDPDFPWTMSNNTEWIINQLGNYAWGVDEGVLPVSNCSCPPPPQMSSLVVTPSTNQGVEPQSSLHNTDPDYDSAPGDAFSLYPKKKDPLVHAEHLKDNARTTASILSKLKDFLFTGVQPPRFPNPLFDYVRLGRNILTKFCPEIYSPVIKNLIGMFRLLLTEIIKKHPEEYSLNIDTGVHQRVLGSLQKCFNGVSNKTAKFIWKQVDTPKNSKQCTNGKTIKKEIISAEIDGKAIPITLSNLPKDIRFVDGDVMLEVAWKILLVTHYACTQYFEEYPEDLSFMYVKGQEFLTIPNVMFRWENPAYGLTAAYKILAPKLNAQELGQQLDACLFAAFETSSFNTWLGRPESASEFIPDSVVQKSMDKLTGNEHSSSAQGRSNSQRNNFYNVFGNTGFCVNDFNDPIIMSSAESHMAESIGITGC